MQTLDAALGIQHEEGTIVTATVFIGFIKEVKRKNASSHDVVSGNDVMPCNKIDKPDVITLRNDLHYIAA